MKHIKHVLVTCIIIFMLTGYSPVIGDTPVTTKTPTGISPQGQTQVAATAGFHASVGAYLILQMEGQVYPARGASLNSLLLASGIVSEVISTLDTTLLTTALRDAPLTIIDASVGSEQGANVSDEVLSLLITYDRPIILLGEAGWLVHRLRGEDPPLYTAPVSQTVVTPNTGAVYLSSPFTISNNSLITTESLTMPVDTVQTEHSRFVNLTRGITGLPVLRYDSYPLDTFILGMEDPDYWTQAGTELLINIIAYATALGESQVGTAIEGTQSDGLLDGGLTYYHEPTLENTYYAVHSVYSLLTPAEWVTWRGDHQTLVDDVLDMSYVEYLTKAEFGTGVKDSAMGLWLVEVMGLSGQYNVTKLVDYLSGEQTAGGFSDSVETTFHVTEALNESGGLGSIDTDALKTWLIDCKILSSETSDPDRWSAIGKNPTSTDPRNSYANFYLRAMEVLGESHDDPVKLTQWIQTRTAAGDGSYSNLLITGIEPITGTACALSSMEIMSTLETDDRTAGLTWFDDNQLQTGGFGLRDDGNDLAGKTEETSLVAMCLDYLSEQSGDIAIGIESFVEGIETPVGFEGMDPIPSMMWGSWLSQVARLSHSTSVLDIDGLHQYIDYYEDLRPYPSWDNLTSYLAPEYWSDQYGTKSVWSQYYGLEMLEYTGHALSGAIGANAEDFIVPCQYVDGHFRLTSMFGTSHMQYTTAAVEALYKLDALGSISDRTALDAIVLSEYASGMWSGSGWTLEPFTGTQQAIDWLSTRTALRLGLVNSTMASEITSVISARVQYDDLWALSRDVATLALLDQEFTISYSSIDTQQVLDALGVTSFSNGWYNESELWQPVFTAGVLEMLSILGLRTEVYDTVGNIIDATVSGTPTSGQDLDIDLSITSTDALHTVYVDAFGSWTQFDSVANTDTVTITVPDGYSYLGNENISVMLWDYGSSRAFDMEEISVIGVLQGELTLDTPVVLVGDKVNGTVAWTLGVSGDAGMTLVKVRLGDPPEYQEWTYPDQERPFTFSIPTSDFGVGTYNLTITLNRSYCNELVLTDTVEILSPDLTYITSSGALSADVGEQVDIPYSLHFQSNGSYVTGQVVTLQVVDEYLQVVHSDTGISTSSSGHFYWTPDTRGNYTYTLDFERNGTLEASLYSSSLDVFEDTSLEWSGPGTADQYSNVNIAVRLTTGSGTPLSGMDVHVTVTSPSMGTVIDTVLTTNSSGYASFSLMLSENGVYTLYAEFESSGLLRESDDADAITSYSTSTVVVGGVDPEGLVDTEWTIWARLTDSLGLPVVGAEITIKVTFLPSTVVLETTLVTNTTGYVDLQWTATGPGTYSIVADYAGNPSRGMGQDSISTDLYVSTGYVLDDTSLLLEVGQPCWMSYYASDNTHDAIPGLVVQFVIRDPSGALVYQTSGITDSMGLVNFTFTLTERGLNNFTVYNTRQTPYEASRLSEVYGVYEQVRVGIALSDDALAPHSNTLVLTLLDMSLNAIEGDTIGTVVILGESVVLDVTNTALADGTVSLLLYFAEPGLLIVTVTHSEQGWLLYVLKEWQTSVLGDTEIIIGTSGLPIDQGTTLGIEVTLTDWQGLPLSGALVTISLEWSNGTMISTDERTTGVDGTCAVAYEFTYIGDFLIRSTFAGTGLNASASALVVQRVTVTPSLTLTHAPTVTVGEELEIEVGIRDHYNYVAGRTLVLTLELGGSTVFETQVVSDTSPVIVHWTATGRGLVTVTLTHLSDTYYLDNFTGSYFSSMEQVSGTLSLDTLQLDIFDSVLLSYTLSGTGNVSGVSIRFEVLGMDLVTIWSSEIFTNSSGIAEVSYTADTTYGVLTVRAEPVESQFLVGGGDQSTLTIMTYCTASTWFEPSPASLGGEVNITVECLDGLGGLIDGLQVRVYLFDPYQEPVRLGSYSDSVVVTVNNGYAYVTFVPEQHGSYEVRLDSSGNTVVHSFTLDHEYHTVHEPTSITVSSITTDIQVDEEFSATVRLVDFYGEVMEGKTLSVTMEGMSPVDLVTDENGEVIWSTPMSGEGAFTFSVSFAGSGVYLASYVEVEVHVRYGTVVHSEDLSLSDIVAGLVPVNVSVLLEDNEGSVLESASILISVYHHTLGLVHEQNVIQWGQEPEELDIMIYIMGNYTIVFSFTGTEHYFPSSSAIEVFVMGTSSLVIGGTSSSDRADAHNITITLLNELSELLPVDALGIVLSGPTTSISGRILESVGSLLFNTTGLPVGSYQLTVTLEDTWDRVGCTSQFQFDITSTCTVTIVGQDTSGVVDGHHSVSVSVIDSLSDILSLPVYISLYDPNGREVYGSIMSTRTELFPVEGLVVIEWTPTSSGNYTLHVQFDGDGYYGSDLYILVTLTRYTSRIEIVLPKETNCTDSITLTLTLYGGQNRLSGKQVTVEISAGEEVLRSEVLTTGYNGKVQLEISGLSAGDLMFMMEYAGSDTYSPYVLMQYVTVYPVIDLTITVSNGPFLGLESTISISVSINGLTSDWRGNMTVSIYGPSDSLVEHWALDLSRQSEQSLVFTPAEEGAYYMTVTLSGLPIISEYNRTVAMLATQPPFEVMLDAGTTPVMGGGAVLALIGFIMRKRLNGAIDGLPGEWE